MSNKEKKTSKKKREKKVQQDDPDAETMKMETSDSPIDKKRKYKKKTAENVQTPVILYVIQCDQCGEYFEKESSFVDHKKHHAFCRLIVRVHIEQKRGNAYIPEFKNPLSPEDAAEFSTHRLYSTRKKKQNVIHCFSYVDDESISPSLVNKVPSIKVFNLRTKMQLGRDLTPIHSVPVVDLDENDNEKSDDEM